MYKSIFFIIIIVFLSIGCNRKYNNHYANVFREQRQNTQQKSEQEKIDEQLLKINQIHNEKEIQQIKGYIKRRNYDMQQLDNGIFIQKIKKGENKYIDSTSKVSTYCDISLLDGKKVFSGKKTIDMKTESDVVGLIYALNGVEDKSTIRCIIPSFLAYGLNGDGKNIPKKATLIYEIQVLKILN
ncbi:MAG: FKBP-type peptidyl-prolyl cis-trans isomerase [Bacteroidales bacterium]|jgi:FKBP-type peptidyl-prolyl cis-trans isomerase|nr:FKBP-type peptidyl-prolyl cis-trans isomerase [Bacteroidales bacterium]